MTTTTKNLPNQDSNYVALESPVKDLRDAIQNHKSKNASNDDFGKIEKAFEVIWKAVFPNVNL